MLPKSPQTKLWRDTRFDRVAEMIATAIDSEALPSVSVAVIQNRQVVWEESFGWANRALSLAATPHTPYSIASVTKSFTATALMMLVERGKVSLDAPINAYLGDMKVRTLVGDEGKVTIRRVANHTSGIPFLVQLFYADEPGHPPPFPETVRRYGIVASPPGERYEYGNLGYGLLSSIVSRVSGRPHHDFVLDELVLPLGLTRTSYYVNPKLSGLEAVRYGRDGVAYPDVDLSAHPGASELYSSAHDLAMYGTFHMNLPMPGQRPEIQAETMIEMQAGSEEDGWRVPYGVGWELDEELGSVSHGGGLGGVSTKLMLLPTAGAAIAVLVNCRSNLPVRVCDEVGCALSDRYSAVKGARTAAANRSMGSRTGPTSQRPPNGLDGEWTGNVSTYVGDIPITWWVDPRDGIAARLGTAQVERVDEVRFDKRRISGHMAGNVETPDAARCMGGIEFDLAMRGEVISGCLAASGPTIDQPDEGAFGGRRLGDWLPHWMEMRRVG